MKNSQSINDDEIDLFKLIETLWNGRVLLFCSVVASIAIGGLFIALNETKYVTRTTYEINLTPPSIGMDEVRADISRAFFKADTFALWKKSRPDTSLTVDLIDQKQMINGAAFRLHENQSFVSFSGNNIAVNSNDTQLIFEVLDYFEFVGLVVSERYFGEAKTERSRIEKLGKRLIANLTLEAESQTLLYVANLERFLDNAAENKQIIVVALPLPPQRTSTSTGMIMTIAILFGGAIGAAFLLAKQAYIDRGLRLARQKA